METPPYLIEQFAAERKISRVMAKRVLYLEGLDTEARKLKDVARMIGVSPNSLKGLARKLIIDFSDYRPYAKRRDAGEELSPFKVDIHRPVNELPIFASLAA